MCVNVPKLKQRIGNRIAVACHELADMGDHRSSQADVIPLHTEQYLEPTYWDDRFSREEHYEWLKDYSHFRHLILSHIKATDRVLELGCGNSLLGEELYKDGITRITRTDLSPVAIKHMQRRNATRAYEGIEYKVADMTQLPFENNTFDVVLEKGTLDCLFVDSGDPWKPKPEAAHRVRKMLNETHRVLTPCGTYISTSFGQPHFRRPFFEAESLTWCMNWKTFGSSFHYFFYTLQKNTRSSEQGSKQFVPVEAKVNFQLEHEFMDNEDYLLQTMLPDHD